MPLHVAKYERRDNADRNELGIAALEACRSTKENAGVISSLYYWVNADEMPSLPTQNPAPGAQELALHSRREALKPCSPSLTLRRTRRQRPGLTHALVQQPGKSVSHNTEVPGLPAVEIEE
jgi:hypothetical protein